MINPWIRSDWRDNCTQYKFVDITDRGVKIDVLVSYKKSFLSDGKKNKKITVLLDYSND